MDRPGRGLRPPAAGPRHEQVLAFSAAVGLLVLYAMRKGTYDLVDRGQLGVLAWWLVALGVGAGWLPRGRLPRAVALPFAGFAALVGWTALALSWTDSQERTAIELGRVVHHAGIYVLVLCLISPRAWRAAAAGLATGGMVVCGFAVASRLAPSAFPSDEVASSFGIERLNYPLNYWNAIAAWGAMTATMALCWSAHAARAAVRAVALAFIPVAVLAVHWSYSRAGVVGLGVGAIASLALARNRWLTFIHLLAAGAACAVTIVIARLQPDLVHATGNNGSGQVFFTLLVAGVLLAGFAVAMQRVETVRPLRLPAAPMRLGLAGLAVAAVIAGAIAGPGLARDGWDSFRNVQPAAKVGASESQEAPTDPAARLTTLGGNRYELWSAALDAFTDHPFKGYGPGTYEYVWNVKARNPEFIRDAHSLYLESLAEMGIVGLLIVVVALGGALALAFAGLGRLAGAPDRGAAAALVAAGLVFLFHLGVDWMWEATAVSVFGLAVLAVAAGPLVAARTGPRGIRFRALVCAAALVACLVQLPPAVSQNRVDASERAADHHHPAEALRRVNDAIDAAPWAATPYTQRALLYERAGKLRSAAIDLERAMKREPENWRWPYLLSRVEAKRGLDAGAVHAYRLARKLRPLASAFSSGQ
jgi:O-antigen ligase